VLRSLSVQWPAGGGVGELGDRSHDLPPSRRSVIIVGEGELVSSSGAFFEGLLAVALEHQLRRPPDVDLGYHSAKMYERPGQRFKAGRAASASAGVTDWPRRMAARGALRLARALKGNAQ
jgi:hypothetical protein